MTAPPLRAGIVGGGWIARVHAPALDATAGVELVAACDLDASRAESIALACGGCAYTSWEQMLERERLDLLWVCTPPLQHRAPVEAALAAGVHVYLEKPVARTLADADAIVAAADRSPAVCAVGYQWHASELVEAARTALAGQPIGMMVGRNLGPTAGRPWFVDQATGGGQILERASHHIDLQRALAGEVVAVDAFAAAVGLAQDGGERSIDDAIVLVLQFVDGAVGTVHAAWTKDGQPGVYATDVVAPEATLALELGADGHRLHGVSRGRAIDAAGGDPMQRSLERFLAAVRGGGPGVACTPADARATLAVALACERSLETGARVAV